MNCGCLHKGTHAPEKCPSCDHARGYFEILGENW
jgi:rubrerythrin